MTDKDLYYDKYLKYKNKYLDLKVQIGGGWNIISSYKPTHIKYKTTDLSNIKNNISIEYTKTETDTYTHTIKIIIKYYDNININIELHLKYSSPTINEITRQSLEGKDSFIKNTNAELHKQFILALEYILTNIKAKEAKETKKAKEAIEATEATKATKATKATEATEATEAIEATETIEATEATEVNEFIIISLAKVLYT